MTKTEKKQLRKAKTKAETMRRIRLKIWHKERGAWASRFRRLSERLHFLVVEGLGAFWFRKRGLPEPAPANVRDDLKNLQERDYSPMFKPLPKWQSQPN